MELEMDIVLIGAGKFGRTLCGHLAREGHNITVLDNDSEVVGRLVEEYDVMGICGSGMSVEDLNSAGAQHADIFIATTAADEINMVSALFAKKLGAKHAIARVRDPMYRKQTGFMREEMGISMMVNPELDAAGEIARMIKFPQAAKVETFAKGRIELAEVRVSRDSKLCDRSLKEIGHRIRNSALICAVERGEEVIIPKGDYILREGDRINLTAMHADLTAFLKETGIIKPKIRTVIIVGGGVIGFYLAKILGESGMSVKVIDSDRANCERINSLLPKADVICGDGTNQQLLIEEGLLTCDALVALTGVDEENIIVSLFAKAKGVDKVITKVNNSDLLPITESIGIDSVISPKDITANIITTYVRAKQNAQGSGVQTLYKLAGGKLEAIEFEVGKSGKYLGVQLKNLKVKDNVLVAGIVKRNKLVIPNGESTIDAGDRVMVVTTNCYLEDLSQIFM